MTGLLLWAYDQLTSLMQGLPDASAGRVIIRGLVALAAVVSASVLISAAPSQSDHRRQARVDEALRREGQALADIANDAIAGRRVPEDVQLTWRNDFFKAQPGTFVPFTITVSPPALSARNALMYVRVESTRHRAGRNASKKGASYAYETIFPVRIDSPEGQAVNLRRGFAVAPGSYRVVVVLKEAPDDLPGRDASPRKTGVIVRSLEVPDFWTGDLTTSSVILADRLEQLSEPIPAAELDENPYVVGTNRIHPADVHAFSRTSELIVVFMVYNPTVGPDRQFDVQVDYHLYIKDPGGAPRGGGDNHPPVRAGERYVTRTSPQRFNPSLMGPRFDPSKGAPVLAGQGILLSAFEPGEYRLAITVTDLLARRTVARDVTFKVIGS